MRTYLTPLMAVLVLGPALVACGNDASDTKSSTIALVDPASAYGKSYAEWSLDWVSYVNSVSPPECISPLMDDSGASCGLYQDEASPVFFLAGNYVGVSIRDNCVAPAGKALFFPLINVWGDNAGVPEDMLLSESDLKAYVESNFDRCYVDQLRLEVDGESVADLAKGGVRSAAYTLELAPMENIYTCGGMDDVEGEFPGYVSGYWAMLAPLDAGEHTLEFGGAAKGSTTSEDQPVGQTYNLTIR